VRAQPLTLTGITKQFPGTLAVNFDPDQTLAFQPGQIHALVGENGAGKSTLATIIAGIQRPTSGAMRLGAEAFTPRDVSAARRLGVDIVLQEPGLVDNLSVEENLLLGREGLFAPFGVFDPRARRRLAETAIGVLPRKIDLGRLTRGLTLEEQKLVELARALSIDPSVLIVDEMSASMSDSGIADLFITLRSFAGRGGLVIYISHHLEEVFKLCDLVTVMKDGRLVRTMTSAETNDDELSTLMVGRATKATMYRSDHTPRTDGPLCLEVEGLTIPGKFRDVSFALHKGEILGIGGLIGCGNEPLALSLFGAMKPASGTIRLHGKTLSMREPTTAISRGIAYLPADRDKDGLILNLPIEKNISLASLPWLSRLGFVSRRQEERVARRFIKELRIVCRNGKQAPIDLSGGNRQKVVLSKWLVKDKDVLILHNPTRGVDVRGKAEIHEVVDQLAARGFAIVLITDELAELIGMSDTILIMRRGTISGRVSRSEQPSEERLISLML
jgi:ABC-type sugar transport system ATPase subunit